MAHLSDEIHTGRMKYSNTMTKQITCDIDQARNKFAKTTNTAISM